MNRVSRVFPLLPSLLLLAVAGSGCVSEQASRLAFWNRENGAAKAPAVPATSSRKKPVSDAAKPEAESSPEEWEARGEWLRALTGYRRRQEDANSAAEFDEARLGAARCLLRLERPAAALAALRPLPASAANDDDRERLALAARACLAMKDFPQAETCLDAAVAGYDLDRPPARWSPSAFANLAKVALENDNPAKAARWYRRAAEQFGATGRDAEAEECLRMAQAAERAAPGGK